MTEADLIASIKGEFVPTPAVLLGSAFGKVLETPDHYRTATATAAATTRSRPT
jgi:hypothetical protein